MNSQSLLCMKDISKSFGMVKALKNVMFDLRHGEVHALLGENGAGKSTLIKILGGIYSKDTGSIVIEGEEKQIKNVDQARINGISIIHQELVLVPYLSVAENVFLGREMKKKNGLLDTEKMREKTQEALTDFGLNLSPAVLVADLNIAQQQMVEIMKAISFHSKIIVMDEPTSSLSDSEVESLFQSIRKLKEKGIGIIYISHRMSELEKIADRVTVMRDGEYIATKKVKETTNDELISLMVGRSLENYYVHNDHTSEDVVLKVDNVTTDKIKNVSFELRKGEILGFAGLIGAGRSETMQAIFGLDQIKEGRVQLEGKELAGKSAAEILQEGVCLVPEDRREQGIFADLPVKFNLTVKVLKQFMHGLRVDGEKESSIVEKYINSLSVKVDNPSSPIRLLSGGNQQKVIIGSWLAVSPKVLIMDEPTRGIDVGSKSEIYTIMDELTKQGMSIIMVSSELPEVLNMSDRIMVMREGKISGVLSREDASQEQIMQMAVNM